MRAAAMLMLSIVASGSGAIGQGASGAGQSAANAPQTQTSDEVIVRGRRLTDLRFEVEQAQERAYTIFNEINSDDDFDVYCREERKYHSRATQRTCRPQFEGRISSSAAQEYLANLFLVCPGGGGVTQECMFDPDYASGARSAAQGVESQLPGKQAQMRDEIFRLAREDDRFAQAILDWYEKTEQYEAARKRRRED